MEEASCKLEFPKTGVHCGCPHHESPTILGSKLGPVIVETPKSPDA